MSPPSLSPCPPACPSPPPSLPLFVFTLMVSVARFWLFGGCSRGGGKGMNVNDMSPDMRESHLAVKAAQKHAQRLAVSQQWLLVRRGLDCVASGNRGRVAAGELPARRARLVYSVRGTGGLLISSARFFPLVAGQCFSFVAAVCAAFNTWRFCLLEEPNIPNCRPPVSSSYRTLLE